MLTEFVDLSDLTCMPLLMAGSDPRGHQLMGSHVPFGCFAQGIASGMGTGSCGDVAALGPQLCHHSGSLNIRAEGEVELLEAAQLSKTFGEWWVRPSGSRVVQGAWWMVEICMHNMQAQLCRGLLGETVACGTSGG